MHHQFSLPSFDHKEIRNPVLENGLEKSRINLELIRVMLQLQITLQYLFTNC